MIEGRDQEDTGEDWKPSPSQLDRANRAKQTLIELGVPTYHQLLFVDDEDQVELPGPIDVARRASVLWVIARAAGEHVAREAAISFLKAEALWEAASPKEQSFLFLRSPGGDMANGFVWNLEGLVVLLWALGEIELLGWPDRQCDLRRLSRIMGGDLASFSILQAPTLRPKAKILDAQQLTLMQHWAARNRMRTNGLPNDLNFSFRKPGSLFSKSTILNMGVVAERHYAFNWMTGLLHPASHDRALLPAEDWDYVDTPTNRVSVG